VFYNCISESYPIDSANNEKLFSLASGSGVYFPLWQSLFKKLQSRHWDSQAMFHPEVPALHSLIKGNSKALACN
jgi:hypothetical protein